VVPKKFYSSVKSNDTGHQCVISCVFASNTDSFPSASLIFSCCLDHSTTTAFFVSYWNYLLWNLSTTIDTFYSGLTNSLDIKPIILCKKTTTKNLKYKKTTTKYKIQKQKKKKQPCHDIQHTSMDQQWLLVSLHWCCVRQLASPAPPKSCNLLLLFQCLSLIKRDALEHHAACNPRSRE